MDENMSIKSRTGAHARESTTGDQELNLAPNPLPFFPPDDDTPDGFPTPDEVKEIWELILDRFEQDYERHTRPPSIPYGDDIERRCKSGACMHLRDSYRQSSPDGLSSLPAHMYANSPGVRTCITCARQLRKLERWACNLCGHPNHTESKLRRRRAVEFTVIDRTPLRLYVAVCRRCEGIVAVHEARKRGPIRAA